LNHLVDPSMHKTSRMAGIWYLLMAICSAFSMMFIDKQVLVPGDAETTAANILASKGLYSLGVVSNLAGQIFFLFLVLALYRHLRSVDMTQARLMVALVVASIPVTCLNTLNQFAPVLLLSGADYLKVFEPAQVNALAMVFLEMYQQGIILVGIFWGLWLLPFGILVYRSGFLPKILGVFLVIGCLGYLLDSISNYLFPAYAAALDPVVMVTGLIGEIPILLWLLIKGINDDRQEFGLWTKRR
jgi:hypothetical protein